LASDSNDDDSDDEEEAVEKQPDLSVLMKKREQHFSKKEVPEKAADK